MKLFISLLTFIFYLNLNADDKIIQSKPRALPINLFSKLKFNKGPIIPGIRQGYVPQGMAFSNTNNLLALSLYSESKRPSIITFINSKTKKLTSFHKLKKSKNEYLYGHVGGVALSPKYIYISSEGHVYQYTYSNNLVFVPKTVYPVETKASFCTFFNGLLFVGEFVYGSKYTSKKSHHIKDRKGINKYALICAYKVENMHEPILAISIRQRVQGMSITEKEVILSVSYGRTNMSSIARYQNPLQNKSHSTINLNKKNIPLYFLDGDNHIETLSFPPMSQGVAFINNHIAVLTESGANKFKSGGKGPVDNIILLKK